MKLTKTLQLAFVLLFAAAGCSYHVDKQTTAVQGPLSFASIKQAVFTPRCSQCHGTSGNFDCSTYANVKERMALIEERVMHRRDMPPGAPLSEAQAKVLQDWITAGAPETGQAVTPPVEKPLEPKFASIREKIFVPMCIACHSPGNSAREVSLETADDLIKSPRILVVPGNSAESGLLISVKRTDRKRMPPPKSGVRALTPEEVGVIKQWIDAGAKD